MTEDLREVVDEGTLNELRQAELVILYKHSTRCPISFGAKHEVDCFVKQTPEVPVFVLNVVQNRALSQQVAEQLGVRHESPQAILMRSGKVMKHASHRQITVQLLERWAAGTAG